MALADGPSCNWVMRGAFWPTDKGEVVDKGDRGPGSRHVEATSEDGRERGNNVENRSSLEASSTMG